MTLREFDHMNKERLLNVAVALRSSPRPEKFTMAHYTNGCGTPACAFGHYASRQDLQDLCYITATGAIKYQGGGGLCDYDDEEILKHFDITDNEAQKLFAPHGCGDAKTPEDAIKFIESFVA